MPYIQYFAKEIAVYDSYPKFAKIGETICFLLKKKKETKGIRLDPFTLG